MKKVIGSVLVLLTLLLWGSAVSASPDIRPWGNSSDTLSADIRPW